MTAKKIISTILCLTTLAALWSCEKEVVNNSPIKSAVKMTTSKITTSKATVYLEPYGDSVATYLVVGPLLADSVPYGTWDGVKRREYIETNGKAFPKPYAENFSGLTPGTTYVMAYLAKRADGVVCSAPSFTTFKTGVADATVKAELKNQFAPFIYAYEATPGKLTTKFKYIFSLDTKYTDLSEDEFKKAVAAEGTMSTDAISTTYVSDKWMKAAFGVLCYDEDGKEGEFQYVAIQGKDEQDVVIDVPAGVTTWETTVQMPAKSKISFNINGESYGYRKMTGNGGVGEAPLEHNGFCALPIANLQNLTTPYSFNCSQGYLEKMTSADAKELWSRLDKTREVYIRLDLSDPTNILYFIQIVPEANVYLDYDCSLLTCGGFYRAGNVKGPAYNGKKTQTPATVTGIEPLTADICGYTDVGTDVMNTPDVACEDKESHINDTYLKNKLLTGWSFKRVAEKGNGFRFSRSDASHYECFIKTPALSSIPAGTDIIVVVRVNRYGSNMAGNVCLTIEGAGKVSGASYWTDKNTTPVDGAAKLSGNVFTIDTDVAAVVQNADKDKPQTFVQLTITGADSSTRVKMYIPDGVNGTDARMSFHGVKITKK